MKLVINVVNVGNENKTDMENSIEFKAPEGLEIPEGTKPGDTFESMATLMLGEEGELYLKELDGIPVSSLEEQKEETEESDDSEDQMGFLDAVERRAEKSKE